MNYMHNNNTFLQKTPNAARVDTWTTLEICPPPGPNAPKDEISPFRGTPHSDFVSACVGSGRWADFESCPLSPLRPFRVRGIDRDFSPIVVFWRCCTTTVFLVRFFRIHPVQSVANNVTQLSGRGFPCIFHMKFVLSQLYVFLVLQNGSRAV